MVHEGLWETQMHLMCLLLKRHEVWGCSMPRSDFICLQHDIRMECCWLKATTIVSLDGSWSCPGNASGSRINHSLHCPDGRQTTFGEAFSKHRYYLTKSGTCMQTFHVAQVHIHPDISRGSNVRPTLKNLVTLTHRWGTCCLADMLMGGTQIGGMLFSGCADMGCVFGVTSLVQWVQRDAVCPELRDLACKLN